MYVLHKTPEILAMLLVREELNFLSLTGLGELEILVHFLRVGSIATLLPQLSLILVCLVLCFRVV